jgi:hypothetical protein
LANFLSISPNEIKFLPSVCLAPAAGLLNFSAIPVSISAVSLRRLSTYILLDFKVAKWAVSYLTHSSNPFQVNFARNSGRKSKRHQKKETSNF